MSDVTLQGDLGHFRPSELLQLLGLARSTGRLELRKGDERAQVYFEAGRPASVRTSGASVRTGDILIHRRQAQAQDIAEALSLQKQSSGRRLGTILIESGKTTAPAVRDAVRESMRRVLYGILLWREGSFQFFPGERDRDADIALDVDLDRLILEALRLADTAGRSA